MDVLHLLLENEPPEKRVRTWLEQCNFTVGDVENEGEEPKVETKSHQGYFRNELREEDKKKKKKKTKTIVSKLESTGSVDSDCDCLASSSNGRPYSVEESQKVIDYIVENDVFPFIKGNILWKRMEMEEVCHRSWQSMKSQFISKIYPRIGSFSVQKEDKKAFAQYMKPSKQRRRFLHLEPGQRGWRKNGNYYTESEDLVILKYILQKRRYLHVHGNSLWQAMEERKVLPARSWQSIRSRYLNIIRHSLKKYEIEESDIEKLENGVNNKEELNIIAHHSPRSKQRTILDKKEQQNIRKYAVVASIKLASDMKKSKEKEKAMRNLEKKTKNSVPSVSDFEIRCNRTQACVKNKSLKRNAENGDLAGNGTLVFDNSSSKENSNYISHTSGEEEQACIEKNSSVRNSQSENDTPGNGTRGCIENNSASENSICVGDKSEEKVPASVGKSSSMAKLENTSDISDNEQQMEGKNNTALGNSNHACGTFKEKVQAHVEENSQIRNLENASDTCVSGIQMSDKSNSIAEKSNCASDTSGEKQTPIEENFRMRNECVGHIENNISQKQSESSENNSIAHQNTTPCWGSASQENAECTENVDKNCGEMKISAEAEEKEEISSDEEVKNEAQSSEKEDMAANK